MSRNYACDSLDAKKKQVFVPLGNKFDIIYVVCFVRFPLCAFTSKLMDVTELSQADVL